jgi:hypothetical protein
VNKYRRGARVQRLHRERIGAWDEVPKKMHHRFAEHLPAQPDDHVHLFATAHHGDRDRIASYVSLLGLRLFPEPRRLATKADEIRRDILRLRPDCGWAQRRLTEGLKDREGRRLFPDRHAHAIALQLHRTVRRPMRN